MTFAVHPPALRTYAGQLREATTAADAAKRYVQKHGSFSVHESGLLGQVSPLHRNLLADLDKLLGHLRNLTETSATALNQVADRYEHTDTRAARDLDATYPAVPRPSPSRD
ncbi:type VII secretion target [Micromonospora siamensis]|uniref:type VII secretion target n=1 Tax=Micromonospora siamensis TaxID=299152 RepID=UPI000B5AD8FE|nr:type VII secretion target [Micromonospora siamensis]